MDAATRIENALLSAMALADLPGCPPKLAAAMRHAVFPRGARVRPRLCLAVAMACGDADPATVCDLTELRLTLRVPSNAQGFAFRSQFFSAEYPTFRCTAFDDTFLALVTSSAYTGNVLVDGGGTRISANSSAIDICLDDSGGNKVFCGATLATGVPANDCSVESGATRPRHGIAPQSRFRSSSTRRLAKGAAASKRSKAARLQNAKLSAPRRGRRPARRDWVYTVGRPALDAGPGRG